MDRRDTAAEIDEVAADWAVRADHAPLAPDEQARLEAWLDGDVRRSGAYARAMAVLLHGKRVKALGSEFDPDSFLAGQPAGDRADLGGARMNRRRFFWIGGTAAAASVLGAVGLSQTARAMTYRTQRGEVRLVPLADGSSMTLNTLSEVRVLYDDKVRTVSLVDGEVLFDVAKDPTRPFIVQAGDTKVCAIGTSFVVRRLEESGVEVTVRQGEVEIARSAGITYVAASMRAIAPKAEPVQTVALRSTEVTRTLAWREGMLSFEDMPLQRAVQEFARYSDIQIRFADPAVATETVTGLFAANNPIGFAKAVASTLGLKATVGRTAVTLHR